MTKKVFVGMSGGVDSSVAAALLKEQGYQVTGVFMKNWTRPIDSAGRVYCPWREDLESAQAAVIHLGIPLKIYNFELAYHDKVVNYFFDEYAKGRTPNPDVMCNREIKFGEFLHRAISEGADHIATGHYARVARNDQQSTVNCQLLRGIDQNKDQSYFLWAIKPAVLRYCLFPIGDYTKPQVRELARRFGLPNAERKDSQGICFIGPIAVSQFLKERLPVRQGEVRSFTSGVVGRHQGAHFLTIGQRHSVGAATGQPVYVSEKDPMTNTVWVDEDWPGSRLYSNSAVITNLNWFDQESWRNLTAGLAIDCEAQVRYRQDPVKATLRSLRFKVQSLKVDFNQPVRAVTEGQSLVCYNDDLMLGGAVIDER